ncbi:HSPB1-associated protein 1 [Drosophila sulfurigaster albostrigata]|uniref:HSPB1-associated protein 1 n=1 Tax=Drosophila sulfurigaster albostrigata TaxID=89887 RepID=UPI002D21B9C7|nr:HSPB1-associated protein 1 [Drosophila sulfurigaster albostrigata]
MNAKLRDIILNTNVPLVLKDFPVNWECFDGSLKDWCTRFDKDASDIPTFESMDIADCETPQWERKRKRFDMSMQQFLNEYSKSEDNKKAKFDWAAYQYKRTDELPPSCWQGIDFKRFGFAEHQNDFSLWLGSKHANTPCHYDTYGINIVVQVYGSKSWLLFPPETALQSTRIPYEESSVYCLENFYAPAPNKLSHYEKFQSQAYHCVLNAGDVLIVPRHWWHYVEADEMSLSINYWVPLKTDLDFTLDELIVKHIIESFVKGESEQLKKYLLNPNQLEEIVEKASSLFSLFESAVHNQTTVSKRKLWDAEYMNQNEVTQVISSIGIRVRALDVMSKEAYNLLIQNNSMRHEAPKDAALATNSNLESNVISSTLELLINSMCAPRCIAGVKRELFRRLGNSGNL